MIKCNTEGEKNIRGGWVELCGFIDEVFIKIWKESDVANSDS